MKRGEFLGRCPLRGSAGFTLVELMVVVLILGILVTIAFPVYTRATTKAEQKSCQANQRTITGAVGVYNSIEGYAVSQSAGEFVGGGSGWYAVLVPEWVRIKPTCATGESNYYLAADGTVMGDSGSSQTFKTGHQVWE